MVLIWKFRVTPELMRLHIAYICQSSCVLLRLNQDISDLIAVESIEFGAGRRLSASFPRQYLAY